MEKQFNLLKAVNEMVHILSNATDERMLIMNLVDHMHLYLGFSGALAGFYNVEDQTIYQIAMRGNLVERGLGAWEEKIPIESQPQKIKEMLFNGHCLVVKPEDEFFNSFGYLLLQFFTRKSVSFCLVCPIKVEHRIIGLLAVPNKSNWSLEENIVFIQSVALQAGITIDRLRAYARLEEANKHWEGCVKGRIRELQKANENLQELNRLKSKFVAVVSHELRTPLTAIQSFVDNLLQGIVGSLEEKQKLYLSRISANAQRLNRLTADLLNLARIESGSMELSMKSLNLFELIEEVVEGLIPMAAAKNVRVLVSPPSILPTLLGDRDRLFQALNNVIQNATKFTGPEGTVSIMMEIIGNQEVRICIADTGCGMANQELEKIFQPFYRISTTPSSKEGTGLGLALTRELVALHEGKIWAESELGYGSRFYISFPLQSPVESIMENNKRMYA